MCSKNSKLRVSPGFLVLLGTLIYLDDGSGVMWRGCAAALIHEIGHITAGAVMGGRVESLSLSFAGAELKLDYPVTLCYGQENLVLLSGAIFNLVSGAIAYYFGAKWFALLSFGLGVFNLLPILPLDGGRVLYNLLAECFDPIRANRLLQILSGILVGILMGTGGILAVQCANVLLLGLSIWLLIGITKRNCDSDLDL